MGRYTQQSKRPSTWRIWTCSLLCNSSRILQPYHILVFSAKNVGILMNWEKEGQSITKLDWGWKKVFLTIRTFSCHLSHKDLPKTKSFLYHQTVQVKQAEGRLGVTECGKWRRLIACVCVVGGIYGRLVGQRFKIIWKWSRTSSRYTSSEPPIDNEGRHKLFTHFPKDPNCEISSRTKTTTAACRRHPEDKNGHLTWATKIRWNSSTKSQKSSMKKESRDCSVIFLLLL